MGPILPAEPAKGLLLEKINEVKARGSIGAKGEAPLEKTGGIMLGCLVGRSANGDLCPSFAFSGAADGRFLVDGWATPCFSNKAFEEVVSRYDSAIHCYSDRIELGETGLEATRAALSNECLSEIRKLYVFHGPQGKAGLPDGLPTGAGDCATVKLLSNCFRRGWEPVSLCEMWVGPETTLRKEGVCYPPCDEKCRPVLKAMLGLDILYGDGDIIVVDKESGMLSVPGIGPEKADCVSARTRRIFPSSPSLPSIHRLDMDTSGVMVLARNDRAKAAVGRQFEERRVKKTYIALLDGLVKEESGTISLPLRPDLDNRPMQMADRANGKEAVTDWERLKVEMVDGRPATRVLFRPRTGRTHQIRVHAALGLGCPVLGDRLYGDGGASGRLRLHAASITFTHPTTGEEVSFSSEPPF